MVSQFEPYLGEPEFEVIKYGEESECMYFLARGSA